MQFSSKLIAIAVILIALSCSNSHSNKIAENISPPKEVEFTTASTARPSNNSGGLEITGTIRGMHVLKMNTGNEIEMILQFPNGKSDNKFYWSSQQNKEYSEPNMKRGILYIGRDDANGYGEVEYFYDAKDSLNCVVLRSPQNNTVIILNNVLQ